MSWSEFEQIYFFPRSPFISCNCLAKVVLLRGHHSAKLPKTRILGAWTKHLSETRKNRDHTARWHSTALRLTPRIARDVRTMANANPSERHAFRAARPPHLTSRRNDAHRAG